MYNTARNCQKQSHAPALSQTKYGILRGLSFYGNLRIMWTELKMVVVVVVIDEVSFDRWLHTSSFNKYYMKSNQGRL